MALFSECMLQCARKLLDTADIVRDRDLTPTVASLGFANDRRVHRIMLLQCAPASLAFLPVLTATAAR